MILLSFLNLYFCSSCLRSRFIQIVVPLALFGYGHYILLIFRNSLLLGYVKAARYLAPQTNEVKPAASNAIYFPGDNVRIRRLFPRQARNERATPRQSDKAAKREKSREKIKRKNARQRIEFSIHASTVLNKWHTESSLKHEAQVLSFRFFKELVYKDIFFSLMVKKQCLYSRL